SKDIHIWHVKRLGINVANSREREDSPKRAGLYIGGCQYGFRKILTGALNIIVISQYRSLRCRAQPSYKHSRTAHEISGGVCPTVVARSGDYNRRDVLSFLAIYCHVSLSWAAVKCYR